MLFKSINKLREKEKKKERKKEGGEIINGLFHSLGLSLAGAHPRSALWFLELQMKRIFCSQRMSKFLRNEMVLSFVAT